ncbi:hypothetical protein [Zooshikella harenae]|uniref:Uncharacterized protein n=1 Tax=Zooshikella harenae TaxID=2827238 RepID=A0ABS5ZI05_9GAMM|nr:hypothetical protein [Zooshikella harenae]MBU2713672.1 hypothetical protein [Zooshikella harenae]
MSFLLAVTLLFTPLLCCFIVLWFIDHSLIKDALANNMQIAVAACLVVLILMYLDSGVPLIYPAQKRINIGIPGLGLMFMVLPGMGHYLTLKKQTSLPAGCWSLLGFLMLCAPFIAALFANS